MMNGVVPLWAVHISDGLLLPSWLIGGGILAALLALVGAFRLREEDVPQIALLAAAFFVVSQVHVPVAGVGSGGDTSGFWGSSGSKWAGVNPRQGLLIPRSQVRVLPGAPDVSCSNLPRPP